MSYSSSCRDPLRPVLILTAAVLLAGTCLAQGTFVSFEGPHAGAASGSGTFPSVINRLGNIALVTIDDSGTRRAYVRQHRNGAYLHIQPPNALDTYISGLNSHGQVSGSFFNTSFQTVGYVRNVDGSYVILNPPGSTGPTTVVGINEAGQVAGNAYINGTATPFFWDPTNPDNYVTFSVPGGTSPSARAINASGQIAGIYTDTATSQPFGFLRNADGTFSTFSVAGTFNLQAYAMNKWGTIACNAFVEIESSSDLFLRYSGGGQRGVVGTSHGGFIPAAINDNGIVVGTDFGGDTLYGNAFSVDKSLTLTLIPVPFSAQGTTANALNNAGQIVGTYIDDNGAGHAWVYVP
jgi:hypothetical protein